MEGDKKKRQMRDEVRKKKEDEEESFEQLVAFAEGALRGPVPRGDGNEVLAEEESREVAVDRVGDSFVQSSDSLNKRLPTRISLELNRRIVRAHRTRTRSQKVVVLRDHAGGVLVSAGERIEQLPCEPLDPTREHLLLAVPCGEKNQCFASAGAFHGRVR